MVRVSICLRVCAFFVTLANIAVAVYIFIYGIFWVQHYYTYKKQGTIGFAVLYFQMSIYLCYIAFLLLIGTIKANQKYISLYLLLSSLTWLVLTILTLTQLITDVSAIERPDMEKLTKEEREHVKYVETILYSTGLVSLWCGQFGVYRFYKQVVERNIIDAGESYVNAAVHS